MVHTRGADKQAASRRKQPGVSSGPGGEWKEKSRPRREQEGGEEGDIGRERLQNLAGALLDLLAWYRTDRGLAAGAIM